MLKLLFLALILTTSHGQSKKKCTKLWSFFNGTCYRSFEIGKNYTRAERKCNAYAPCGRLAMPKTQAIYSYLQGQFVENPYWIGISDRVEEGRFQWADHSDVGFLPYTTIKQDVDNNRGDRHDCVLMDNFETLRDAFCLQEWQYICEKKWVSNKTTPEFIASISCPGPAITATQSSIGSTTVKQQSSNDEQPVFSLANCTTESSIFHLPEVPMGVASVCGIIVTVLTIHVEVNWTRYWIYVAKKRREKRKKKKEAEKKKGKGNNISSSSSDDDDSEPALLEVVKAKAEKETLFSRYWQKFTTAKNKRAKKRKIAATASRIKKFNAADKKSKTPKKEGSVLSKQSGSTLSKKSKPVYPNKSKSTIGKKNQKGNHPQKKKGTRSHHSRSRHCSESSDSSS